MPVPRGPIYRDANDKKDLEGRNGLKQARFVFQEVAAWNPESRLTPDLLRELQRLAVNQIYRCAGHFRDGEVRIEGVAHQPPHHSEVPSLVEEMCEYVHANFNTRTPVHLASYLMWRMNWIHPFFGGNGRTARACSYLILCARLGFEIPGARSILDLIVDNRDLYYASLRAADDAWRYNVIDVSEMEDLLSNLLAEQLLAIHEEATGRPAT
jgi:Fic family protein